MKYITLAYKKVILPACLVFTVICFTFSLIFASDGENAQLMMINTSNLAQILLFSVIFSSANLLFGVGRLKFPLALLLHYLSTVTDILTVFFIFGGHYSSVSNTLAVMLVFSVIYFVFAFVAMLTKKVFSKKDTEIKSEYKRRF